MVLNESSFTNFGFDEYGPPPERFDSEYLIIYLSIQAISFYGLGSLIGYLKRRTNSDVNISRKLFCMIFYCVSLIIPRFIHQGHVGRETLIISTTLMTIFLISTMSRGIRKWFFPSRLVFEAVSREGEHSQTVKWLQTEAIATSAIIYLAAPTMGKIWQVSEFLYLMPSMASGFADAAAEIVGTRWGKRKYPAFGFFVKKEFHRTVEGSLAFLVVTALFSLLFVSQISWGFTPAVMWCFILLPVTLCLAEAVSPHTMDNPVIFATGYLTIYLIHQYYAALA